MLCCAEFAWARAEMPDWFRMVNRDKLATHGWNVRRGGCRLRRRSVLRLVADHVAGCLQPV